MRRLIDANLWTLGLAVLLALLLLATKLIQPDFGASGLDSLARAALPFALAGALLLWLGWWIAAGVLLVLLSPLLVVVALKLRRRRRRRRAPDPVRRVAGGWRIFSRAEYAPVVERHGHNQGRHVESLRKVKPAPRWAPAQGRNSSTRVFVTSSAPIDVCVTDANGVATPLKVKPGAMFSASGKPPYVVQSPLLHDIDIYLQGMRARVPPQTPALRLQATPVTAPDAG